MHDAVHDLLGAHPHTGGTTFRVWAPNARMVHVFGEFDEWNPDAHPMVLEGPAGGAGVWEATVADAGHGHRYRYRVEGADGHVSDRADPMGFRCAGDPPDVSQVWDLDFSWSDHDWLEGRRQPHHEARPLSVYELHLGSWLGAGLGYLDLADRIVDHVRELGFTHVELMPVMEHPYYGSWGYQVTGQFAATNRYGTPQELMALIDRLHRNDIGVLLDWVPAHFPADGFALARFDGTPLYEHADPRRGMHPDWGSLVFDLGRPEVRSFLVSSARFWLERYHADGLRVDAVASMLYLDYSRGPGEWEPNVFGGVENLEAVEFLRRLTSTLSARHPDTIHVAEESTAWPGVTTPVAEGGLGFSYKWDLGWMHDTLAYLALPLDERRSAHEALTFRSLYQSAECFVLPLSHDEVVHGKGSLNHKQRGDPTQRLAGLRTLLGLQWAEPGKKLLFMGAELAVETEWDHHGTLPWATRDDPGPAGMVAWVAALNRLYRGTPALHRNDRPASDPVDGCPYPGPEFEWIVGDDRSNGVLVFVRRTPAEPPVLVVASLGDSVVRGYRFGVPSPIGDSQQTGGSRPEAGEGMGDGQTPTWSVVLASTGTEFGGDGGWPPELQAEAHPSHGKALSVTLDLPPRSVAFLVPESTTSP